eukprot:TRINITY_DN7245_c0_g1_i1.p1 TRINITY_DN7245_c0_g1~~TRINITY_DN7245_c0_g1_i1.p1  ORF type:complete len:133 (+),score=30.08 TRINITY_DN7245_c0_g1_i1:30-401(+)
MNTTTLSLFMLLAISTTFALECYTGYSDTVEGWVESNADISIEKCKVEENACFRHVAAQPTDGSLDTRISGGCYRLTSSYQSAGCYRSELYAQGAFCLCEGDLCNGSVSYVVGFAMLLVALIL